jgi:hypothetical protein
MYVRCLEYGYLVGEPWQIRAVRWKVARELFSLIYANID